MKLLAICCTLAAIASVQCRTLENGESVRHENGKPVNDKAEDAKYCDMRMARMVQRGAPEQFCSMRKYWRKCPTRCPNDFDLKELKQAAKKEREAKKETEVEKKKEIQAEKVTEEKRKMAVKKEIEEKKLKAEKEHKEHMEALKEKEVERQTEEKKRKMAVKKEREEKKLKADKERKEHKEALTEKEVELKTEEKKTLAEEKPASDYKSIAKRTHASKIAFEKKMLEAKAKAVLLKEAQDAALKAAKEASKFMEIAEEKAREAGEREEEPSQVIELEPVEEEPSQVEELEHVERVEEEPSQGDDQEEMVPLPVEEETRKEDASEEKGAINENSEKEIIEEQIRIISGMVNKETELRQQREAEQKQREEQQAQQAEQQKQREEQRKEKLQQQKQKKQLKRQEVELQKMELKKDRLLKMNIVKKLAISQEIEKIDAQEKDLMAQAAAIGNGETPPMQLKAHVEDSNSKEVKIKRELQWQLAEEEKLKREAVRLARQAKAQQHKLQLEAKKLEGKKLEEILMLHALEETSVDENMKIKIYEKKSLEIKKNMEQAKEVSSPADPITNKHEKFQNFLQKLKNTGGLEAFKTKMEKKKAKELAVQKKINQLNEQEQKNAEHLKKVQAAVNNQNKKVLAIEKKETQIKEAIPKMEKKIKANQKAAAVLESKVESDIKIMPAEEAAEITVVDEEPVPNESLEVEGVAKVALENAAEEVEEDLDLEEDLEIAKADANIKMIQSKIDASFIDNALAAEDNEAQLEKDEAKLVMIEEKIDASFLEVDQPADEEAKREENMNNENKVVDIEQIDSYENTGVLANIQTRLSNMIWPV